MAAIVAILPQDATKARRVMDKTPLNPNGRKLRKFEKDGEARIYDALQKWGRALFRGVTADTVALLTARLDDPEFNKPLRDAMITFLQEVADAGAEHGRAQVEQVFMGVKRIPDVAAGAVDWTAANTDAAQWAIEYGYQLINGITDTTRAQVAREIRYFVDNSISIGQLRDRLMAGNLFSRNRAEMIAITEVTRAFAEGNTAAWKASKVVEGREWQTAVDERVCPLCGPLHAQIAKMGEPFKGGADNPPRHVRCRCWVLPVVMGDTEVLSPGGLPEWGVGGAGPVAQAFPAFIPATSPAEVSARINRIVENYDLKNIPLDIQNSILSEVEDMNRRYGIKLYRIGYTDKNDVLATTARLGNGNSTVDFSRRFLQNPAAFTAEQRRAYEALPVRMREGSTRYAVFTDSKNPVTSATRHELYHVLDGELSRIQDGRAYVPSEILYSELLDQKRNMSAISMYARSLPEELFAELGAAIDEGLDIPTGWLDIFNMVIR